MKKRCLLAISITGLIMFVVAFITDIKLFYLLGSIVLLLTSVVQLWQTYKNK